MFLDPPALFLRGCMRTERTQLGGVSWAIAEFRPARYRIQFLHGDEVDVELHPSPALITSRPAKYRNRPLAGGTGTTLHDLPIRCWQKVRRRQRNLPGERGDPRRRRVIVSAL